MPIQRYFSRKEFESHFKKIDSVLSESDSNFIITNELHIIDKRSFSWKILCLFKGFYRLFGKDIYSHVRANQVALGIMQTCQYHRNFLNDRPLLVGKIEKQILMRLKDKTHGKYDADIDKAISELNSIIKKPDGQTKKESRDEPFSNPLDTTVDFTLKRGIEIGWPSQSCLKTLEITEADLRFVRVPLKSGLQDLVKNPTHDLRFVKDKNVRKLQLIDLNVWVEGGEITLSETVIPFSLEIVRSPTKQITDIIILAKKVLAKGGQSKVRLCYSVFRKMKLVRKSCHSKTQQLILKHFLSNPTRGIVPIFFLRDRKDKKMQVIEPFLEHVLDKVVNKLDHNAKVSIAQDLLYGICAVHRLKEAHRDLKPSNILVEKIEGVWRGFITDFGFADREFVGGSLGYRSPEQIAVSAEIASRNSYSFSPFPYYYKIINQFHLSQLGDMWSMGLVLFYLFFNQKGGGEHELPYFIKRKIVPKSNFFGGFDFLPLDLLGNKQPPIDIGVLNDLSQKEIDASLMDLKKYLLRLTPSNLEAEVEKWWDLIGKMVRQLPEERISSEAAVAAIT